MRRLLLALVMMLTPTMLLGQSDLSGDWQATVHYFGSAQYAILHREQTGEKVTGTIFRAKIGPFDFVARPAAVPSGAPQTQQFTPTKSTTSDRSMSPCCTSRRSTQLKRGA